MMSMFKSLLPSKLRTYKEVHIGEAFPVLSGDHTNELFYNCSVDKVAGLTLKHCVLSGTQFVTQGIKNLLGLTVTLDCNTFNNVEFSADMFDLMLLLLCKTKGNTEKRAKLIEVVGRDRAYQLLKQMEYLEKPIT